MKFAKKDDENGMYNQLKLTYPFMDVKCSPLQQHMLMQSAFQTQNTWMTLHCLLKHSYRNHHSLHRTYHNKSTIYRVQPHDHTQIVTMFKF